MASLVLVALASTAFIATPPVSGQTATGAPGPVVISTPTGLTPVRAIVNPSFDINAVNSGAWTMVEALNGTQSPRMEGWQSTHPPTANFGGRDHPIEVWGSPFNNVGSVTGTTLIELNANVSSAVFQDLCLELNEPVGWSFFHHARSRNTTEIVQVTISDPTTWTGVTAPPAPAYSSGDLPVTRAQLWVNHTGAWNGNHPAGAYRFAFDAVQGGNGPSYGNLLDEVTVDLPALAEFIDAPGVNPTSTSEAAGARVAFVLNGRLTVPTNIRLQPTAAATVNGSDIVGISVVDGAGNAFAGASAAVQPDGAIDVTIPPGIYWPNERDSYVQLLLDLDDAVADVNETASWSLVAGNPDLRPGDAMCDGPDQPDVTFSITAALDLALNLSTPDVPAEASDVIFTASVSNVDGLPDPGPIEVAIDFTPAYNSLGGSGTGWSCSNNSSRIRCFFVNPLAPGETTPDLTILTSVVGSVGALAEASGLASSTQTEANLTNNAVTISGTVQPGLPGTGIETESGLSSGFGLIALGFGLVWLAWRLDLRGAVLQRGMQTLERGSTRWRS